ncbi:hypothetical protein HPULCUR_010227 [Helicostylum pulchrum]|uniref:Transmembrane protein n=1 Tax=Helicostylum pulchrum TaxID=562976 RepID=A0ABP9YCP4_9FUNG
MQSSQNSTKVYMDDDTTRTSTEPMNPSTDKLQNSSAHSSTVSIDMGLAKDDTVNKPPPTKLERFTLFLRFIRPIVTMLVIDVGLPLAIYYVLKIWLSILVSLILSGIPPLVRVIYVFWKRRKIDILGCIFVTSFLISAVLSLISGNARVALIRDSATTAIVSLMFLVTLIPLRTKWFTVRPLIYLISQQMMVESPPVTWTDRSGEEKSQELMEWIWENCKIFRTYCYVLCAIWGVALMGEFVAKVIMIQSTLTIDQVLLYGNIIVITVVLVITVGTIIASRSIRKRTTAIAAAWKLENDFAKDFPKDNTK